MTVARQHATALPSPEEESHTDRNEQTENDALYLYRSRNARASQQDRAHVARLVCRPRPGSSFRRRTGTRSFATGSRRARTA